jgi:hypothetical protein
MEQNHSVGAHSSEGESRQPFPHVTEHRLYVFALSQVPQNGTRGTITSDILKSNYGLFNRNNIYIRSWSWNYRGCWHQTCPPMVTQQCELDTIHYNL